MMTERQTARLLRLSVRTLRNWRSAMKGPAWFKVGGRVFYDKPDVERWLFQQKVDPEKQRRSSGRSRRPAAPAVTKRLAKRREERQRGGK